MTARSDLETSLPFLVHWEGSRKALGMPCALPECRSFVFRTRKGRQAVYCKKRGHRSKARHQRAKIVEEISRIETALATTARRTPGFDREQLTADLAYLRVCLSLYLEPDARRVAQPDLG